MSRAPSKTATKIRIASVVAILAILGAIIPATAAHSTTGLCGFGFYPPCDDPVVQPPPTTTTACVGPRCQVAPVGPGVLDPGPAGTVAPTTSPATTTTPGTVTTTKPGTATSSTKAGGTVAPGKTQTGNKTGSGGTQGDSETVPETVPASPAAVTDEEAQSDSGLPLFAILAIVLVLAGAAFGGFRFMKRKQS
ncbi:MAG: hypothetical protein WD627_11420 [Actinomycetota bacterium]